MPREKENAIKPVPTAAEGTLKAPAVHDEALRMSYRIARGEQGVLTFEPYKSAILPLWRFKDPDIARKSSQALWTRFLDYDQLDDFVGMDMTRKFIQMGMTRAKRYANHRGGRKYAKTADGSRGEQLPKSEGHKDMVEKKEASDIFRAVWQRCLQHESYLDRKTHFVEEQKRWDANGKSGKIDKVTGQLKPER